MLNRPTQTVPPMSDDKFSEIDRQLATLFLKGTQIRTGTYVGDGRTSHVVTMGLTPSFVYIQRQGDLGRDSFPVAGNAVFSMLSNPGVSYIPGTGFVKDAVLSYQATGITIGDNVSVNTINVTYCYFALA